jgi:hypothetical protein
MNYFRSQLSLTNLGGLQTKDAALSVRLLPSPLGLSSLMNSSKVHSLPSVSSVRADGCLSALELIGIVDMALEILDCFDDEASQSTLKTYGL